MAPITAALAARVSVRGLLSVLVAVFMGSIVTLFYTIEQREDAAAEMVRGNYLWSTYQLDRETVRAIAAIEGVLARPGEVSGGDIAQVSDRIDILYSRIGAFGGSARARTLEHERSVVQQRDAIRPRIERVATLADALPRAPDPRATLTRLLNELEQILPLTGSLLGSVHQMETENALIRRDTTAELHRLLAAAVGGLAMAMLGLMIVSMQQVKSAARTREVLERVERENLEQSLALAQRDEQAQLLRREAALAEQLAAFNTRMNHSVTSLASMIEDITDQCTAMVKAADLARLDSEKAAQSSVRVADHVSSVAQTAAQMSESARTISRKTLETGRAASDMHGQADHSGQTINRLVAAAAQIDSVTQLIASVAKRTNLLALNAAIEAARAGESGRGFAVVAGEVKSLAQQTAAATSEIARQVEAIQSASASCVEAMDAIRSRIVSLDTIGGQISRITEDQSQTVEEVASMIGHAAAESELASSRVRSVMQATENANAAADAVLSLMVRVNEEGRRIRREIESFGTNVLEAGVSYPPSERSAGA